MIGVGSGGNRVVGNVLAGGVGVIDPGSSYNAIVGNLIGVDASGSRALESGAEIVIGEPFNQVGGTLPGEGNIINGRIVIQATDVLVLSNRLGVDEGGNPLGSGSIVAIKPRAIIGGRSSGAANVIVGGGIEIRSDSNVLLGNRISQRELKDEIGIWIVNAGRNHVIANVIETNAGTGILLAEGAYENVLRGNVLRLNRVGLLADPSSERNVITGNAFEENGTQAQDMGKANAWDDGRRGNYWSDVVGRDVDGDGVFDQSLAVEPNGVDSFPLAQPP
jgi:parallel beta-helix repeat protein